MTNKIIIDGWNVCWRIPELAQSIKSDLALVRKKFNVLIKNYYQSKNIIYKIIYDGQPGIINSELNKNIHFSKNPESADQKILSFLKKQKSAQSWTIITSDKELAGRAKNLGAQIISSEEFIAKLEKRKTKYNEKPEKVNPNLSREEINNWIHLFNKK